MSFIYNPFLMIRFLFLRKLKIFKQKPWFWVVIWNIRNSLANISFWFKPLFVSEAISQSETKIQNNDSNP